MVKKKLIIFLITIFLIVAFAESYDVKGIEELDYVIAIGFDKSEKDPENYSITFQIAKPKDKDSGKTTAETITIDAPTFDTALSSINNSNDKLLNLTHCSARIISEELAREGLESLILNMENNVELRPTCNLFISKDKSESLIDTIGKSENFSSDIYTRIIKSGLYTGYETQTLLYDFYSNMRYSVKNPIAIYIRNSEKNVVPLGLTIFKKDKLVGIISGTEVICNNIITNKLKSATILVPNPIEDGKYLTADITQFKKTSNTVELENDKPIITSSIYLKARVSSSQSTNDDYTSAKDNEKIINSIEEYLSYNISSYFNKISREYNSDIVGFEGDLKKQYLTLDDYKNDVDWENIFSNAEFKLKIDLDLDSSYLFQRH